MKATALLHEISRELPIKKATELENIAADLTAAAFNAGIRSGLRLGERIAVGLIRTINEESLKNMSSVQIAYKLIFEEKEKLGNNVITLFPSSVKMCLLQNRYFFQVKFFEISEVGVS